MANPSGRSRPLYEPDKQFFKRLIDQSGKSIVDYAHELSCGETTLRKLLSGDRVAAETLKNIAHQLKLDWHDLLSDSEKERIGIGPINAVASDAVVQDTPSPGLS